MRVSQYSHMQNGLLSSRLLEGVERRLHPVATESRRSVTHTSLASVPRGLMLQCSRQVPCGDGQGSRRISVRNVLGKQTKIQPVLHGRGL